MKISIINFSLTNTERAAFILLILGVCCLIAAWAFWSGHTYMLWCLLAFVPLLYEGIASYCALTDESLHIRCIQTFRMTSIPLEAIREIKVEYYKPLGMVYVKTDESKYYFCVSNPLNLVQTVLQMQKKRRN